MQNPEVVFSPPLLKSNGDAHSSEDEPDPSSSAVYNWSLFAVREPRLDRAHLVPTVVFGRGALLVRRAAVAGEDVAIFCPSGDDQKEEEEEGDKNSRKTCEFILVTSHS